MMTVNASTLITSRYAICLLTLAALGVSACAEQPQPTTPSSSPAGSVPVIASPAETKPGVAPTPTLPAAVLPIPQPVAPTDIALAPDAARVDLVMPIFTDGADVTNPLFPVSQQHSVLLLGEVDGLAFRTEVTLLAESRWVAWEGQLIEALVSQYVAHLDGRIHEVAYDFYAQSDDGDVWYLGEDVFNFADGSIVDTHGTWLAGTDGPAAMIMPFGPQVGDVYRPENAPGLVFEEVVVKAIDQPLQGPFGPLPGGLEIIETHMDGGTEAKVFAPGYGEFYTGGGGDVEALALAVPTDSATGPMPAEIQALWSRCLASVDALIAGDRSAASAEASALEAAWAAISPQDVAHLMRVPLEGTITTLVAAVDRPASAAAERAAIDAARLTLDLQLRYRSVPDIDLARFDLWAAQMILDAKAGSASLARGDFFGLDYVRDRIRGALDPVDAVRLNTLLETLDGAVADEDLAAVERIGHELRTVTQGIVLGG